MVDIIKRNNVQVKGDGKKTLMYAHGFGCNQDMWDQVVPAFTEEYKQILFDYVGSGQSDLSSWSKDRYSNLNGYADDIIEICDTLDLKEDVILIGHSVSATIAMLASISRPTLFSRLILIGPTPCFLNHPPDYNGGFDKPDLEDLLELMDNNYLGWASYLAPVVSGEDGETTNRLERSFCSTDPTAAKIFAEATFFADNRDDIQNVHVPSLIIQHARDNLVPLEIGNYLEANLKNSTLEVLDVSGHCAHMSHPNLVIDAIKSYIE